MAHVDGYQLQELQMLVVLYSQIALQLLEKHHNNVKHGAVHAFLMEYLVYQNHNAPRIKLN